MSTLPGVFVVGRWRMDYNHYRLHSSLEYMVLAAFAAKCFEEGSAPPTSGEGQYVDLLPET